MFHGRYLLGVQKFRCLFTCSRCGAENRETGFVRAGDLVRLNGFADNLGDEFHLSGEITTEKAQKRFHALQARVNGHCWYSGLRVSGRCSKCGKRQFWSPFLRHVAAAAISVCVLAGLICLYIRPVDLDGALMLTGITAVSALLTEGIALLAARLWARRQPEEHLPWLEAVHRKRV